MFIIMMIIIKMNKIMSEGGGGEIKGESEKEEKFKSNPLKIFILLNKKKNIF